MDGRRQQFSHPPPSSHHGHHHHSHTPGPRSSSSSSSSFSSSQSLSGQKRSYHHRSSEGGGFAKLFVGSLPRNIAEDEVRGLFGAYGNIIEVVILKDKKSGLPQGCCFIKYATTAEAERAIRALDNQRTLPGGSAPLQVKFADSERDHSGHTEHKLFVGSLNKQANEQEIEEIFAPYGRVDNIYIIRDDHKQSRGCAFVTFPDRDMAISAISGLNGIYRMAGCHQPIIVRFADPKRPRSGDQRSGGSGPGPNYSPRSHQGSGGMRGSGVAQMGARSPVYGWRQGGGSGGPGGMGVLPQTGVLPMGPPLSPSLRGPMEGPNIPMGMRAGGPPIQAPPSISGPLTMSGMSPQMSHPQGLGDLKLGHMMGQQIPSHQQQPQQVLAHPMQQPYQFQSVQGFPLTQTSDTRTQQPVALGQYSSPQSTTPVYSQGSMPQRRTQVQMATPMQQPVLQMPIVPHHPQESQPSQQPTVAQAVQPLQRQVLPVQTQMEPGAAKETLQQGYVQMTSQQQPLAMQPSWSVPLQQQAVASAAAATTAPVSVAPVAASVTCEWTEHTSPEGHKYYYNSSTGESRWEKPDEFVAFEQQQKQQQLQASHHLQQQQPQPQQAQIHVQGQQQLQPQLTNLQQYQQQPHAMNPQPQQQQNPSQQVQHYLQPQVQQSLLQQPQLQQQQQQHIIPAQQQTQLQQSREVQFQSPAATSVQYPQSATGASYQQPVQSYGQVQPSNGSRPQQLMPSQQVLQAPSANGISDQARSAQWMPAATQQGVPNQEWMWKSKPTGS